MNCYYSNLIEDRHTHLQDIERALNNDYSTSPQKRNLQHEARAHIHVQELIDTNSIPHPIHSEDYLRTLHKEFCQLLPPALLKVPHPTTKQLHDVIPGEYRSNPVTVGNHDAPSHTQLSALMRQFIDAYPFHEGMQPLTYIVAIAAAHHRFLWIHPFLDGNGRVARLHSHALLSAVPLGNGLWSISRGLAKTSSTYKQHLQDADEPRQGDLDGRGNLSDRSLFAFCRYFLQTCADQVSFMHNLISPENLVASVSVWAKEQIHAKHLPAQSDAILSYLAKHGEMPRSAATTITGYQERQARTVVSELLSAKLVTSPSPRAPIQLAFPVHVVERWLPRLYTPHVALNP